MILWMNGAKVIKFAIEVMLADNDWIYVTEHNGGRYCDLQPVLFDTRTEAENYASTWKQPRKYTRVNVVDYYVQ
jgi:hypothetical protein